MYSNNGRLTAHGTLMLDLDVSILPQILRPKQEKSRQRNQVGTFTRDKYQTLLSALNIKT